MEFPPVPPNKMTLYHLLHLLAYTSFLVVNVGVFFYAFPAYKRTRRLAFLLLVVSCGLGTFVAVWDWTFMQTSRVSNPNQFYWFYCIRQAVYLGTSVCSGLCSYLFIRALDPQPSRPKLRDLLDRENSHQPKIPRITCPACETEWELTVEEATRSTFTCAECGNTTYLPGDLAGKA